MSVVGDELILTAEHGEQQAISKVTYSGTGSNISPLNDLVWEKLDFNNFPTDFTTEDIIKLCIAFTISINTNVDPHTVELSTNTSFKYNYEEIIFSLSGGPTSHPIATFGNIGSDNRIVIVSLTSPQLSFFNNPAYNPILSLYAYYWYKNNNEMVINSDAVHINRDTLSSNIIAMYRGRIQ